MTAGFPTVLQPFSRTIQLSVTLHSHSSSYYRRSKSLSSTNRCVTGVTMKTLALLSLAAACSVGTAIAQNNDFHEGPIRRVLLISVDGMHAVDFTNCANGISTANNGDPYC